jgi:hypothetical protein
MKSISTLALVLVSATMIACEAQPTRTQPGQPQPLAIVRQLHGSDSGLADMTVALVNSQQDLATLGSTQLVNEPIDFGSHSLVVVALGERPTGGYWAQIEGVQVAGNTLYVQAVANRPGSDEMTTQALTHPYAAAVVPKTRATMLRSEVRSVQGEPAPGGK